MAHSLDALGRMEPIKMPKEWLKPGAQAWGPDAAVAGGGWREGWSAVLKMGQKRLQGAGWELTMCGNPSRLSRRL